MNLITATNIPKLLALEIAYLKSSQVDWQQPPTALAGIAKKIAKKIEDFLSHPFTPLEKEYFDANNGYLP